MTALHPAVPNPVTGDVQIGFDLREAGLVRLDILEVSGRVVAELPSRVWTAGTWETQRNGKGVPSGVHWVRMSVGTHEVGRGKFLLLR